MQTDATASARNRVGLLHKLAGFIIAALLILFSFQPGLSSQVTIAWDPNPQPEVEGYKLYHGATSGQYSGASDIGDQTSATLSGLQAGITYFIAATAYDVYGNQSNYSEEVSFTVPSGGQNHSMTFNLSPGWALLSLPFQLENPVIATVLAPISGKYSVVWAYRNGQWSYYDSTDPGGSTLSTIDAGSAYWIKMTSSAQLQIAGASASKNANLVTGWNFVGYANASPQPITSVLSSIAGKYDLVWTCTNDQWSYYDATDPGGSTLSQFQPGKGYWIKMKASAIWTLP